MEIYRRAWIRNGLSQAEFDKAEDGLRIAVGEALMKLEPNIWPKEISDLQSKIPLDRHR